MVKIWNSFAHSFRQTSSKVSLNFSIIVEFVLQRIRDEAIQCKTDGRYPATEALREVNIKKNRFRDIAPCEYS